MQWALPLVAGFWVCGLVSTAFAQEPRMLVSNTGQPTASGSSPVLSIQSLAMQFSTGESASPWTLTAIQLDIGAWQSGATPTVSLHAASGQSPGARIATLTNPAAGTGVKAFTAPSVPNVTLQANTTYTVVVESDTTFLNFNGFALVNTKSAAEDSGGASGWQISDTRLSNSGSGWSPSEGTLRLRMAVLGTGGSASDDATLNTLALADAGSNAIVLTPSFAAGTTSYTATVAHSVSTMTVAATATDTSATVSISDDDDIATPGTAEIDLDVGANTVTATVTAEDATTTSTYSVTVTRAPAPPNSPRMLVGNTGQSTASRPAPVFALQSLAVQFSTGNSAERWTLTAIQLEVVAWQSGVAPTVSLHAASGQNPGTKIATMTNPASGSGSKEFTAPSDVKLQGNTTYTVVVESASSTFNGFTLSRTESAAEDNGVAAGWGISNTGLSRFGQAWSSGSNKLKLAVLGTADSDDATLSTLTLADDSSNVALDPAFAADTTQYTATVAHSVTTLTVAADAADDNATVSIANDDDDATPGTAGLDLDVGSNTVAVTVTAEDATTTSTYTVTVTRAAAAPAPDSTPHPQTLVGNNGQPAHSSVAFHDGRRRVGIQFRTGDSTTAWTLSAIRIQVASWRKGVTPTVKLRRMAGEWPGATIATLTNPSRGTGFKTFTAPTGLKLEPNTDYAVVVAERSGNRRFSLGLTNGNDEDPGGAPGWRIANKSRVHESGSWSPLRQSLVIAVQGTAVADDATPSGLTGWFAWKPVDHDGSGEFKVRIGFSDPIRTSRTAMRDHAVQVSGARVTTAKRLQTHSDMWNISIVPTGLDAISVTVEGGRECGPDAVICTEDGRALAETLALTVPGPLALAVTDAEAREGADPAVVFTVALNRASTGQVTVDYATSDGTARAGEDYTAASGTLTFAAGVVEQTVNVPVLDDVMDEGEESFTFALSNATGALIGDAEATGTIVNSDPMPNAWIARFGRTIAAQTTGAIGERLAHDGGSRIVVGGMTLGGTGNVSELEVERDSLRYGDLGDPDERRHAVHARSMTPRELLLGSEFQLSGGDGESTPAWTAWGRVATSGFEATQDEVAMDGDVTTGILGIDVSSHRWLAGLAVGLSEGDGSFAPIADGRADDKGKIESRLASVYPYTRHRLTERVEVWGLVGYGTGELTITEHAGGNRSRDVVTDTDLSMRMGALGTNAKVLSAAESGGLELAVKADAFWVRMESEAVESEGSGRMAAAAGDASRVRIVVQGWRAFELAPGRTFTPSAQLGVRHDGGDAETGTGFEIGAGARLGGPRFAIEGMVRTLVAHEESGYQEWGASGSIRIAPGASGRGLSLTLGPAWGAASSGVERLWSLSNARGLARDDDFKAGRRLEAEVGYGLEFGGAPGVLTPYTGLSVASGGNRAYRTGARWVFGPDMALRLEAAREATTGDDSPVDSLTLRAEVRW